MNAFSIFAAAAEAPHQIALIADGVPYTFSDLLPLVRQAMAFLEDHQVDSQSRVAVVLQNRFPLLILIYALLEKQILIILIHPKLTEAEQQQILLDSSATHTIFPDWDLPRVSKNCKFNIPDQPQIVRQRQDKTILLPSDKTKQNLFETEVNNFEKPLAILYTSGTSGQAKGAVLSYRAFYASAKASEQNLGWQENDRWLVFIPLAHIGGFSTFIRCLIARKCVVINQPKPGKTTLSFDPEEILTLMQHQKVTLFSVVPTMLKRLLEVKQSTPSCLRALLVGGAPASLPLLEQASEKKIPFLTTYGLTEACSQVTTQSYSTRGQIGYGVGPPIGKMEVQLVQEEIYIRGPSLFLGYHIGKSKAGWSYPFDANGFFPTGDLGTWDHLGNLHILSRRTDLILSGGENVYPAEVEQVLERYPGIQAACVFGIPDEKWGQKIVAVLMRSASGQSELNVTALKSYIKKQLAPYKWPRELAFLSQFVINSASKIDRQKTAQQARPILEPFI